MPNEEFFLAGFEDELQKIAGVTFRYRINRGPWIRYSGQRPGDPMRRIRLNVAKPVREESVKLPLATMAGLGLLGAGAGLARHGVGYAIGRGVGPKTKEEAEKALTQKESMLGHLFVPGYTSYMYGKKGKAREIMRGDKD